MQNRNTSATVAVTLTILAAVTTAGADSIQWRSGAVDTTFEGPVRTTQRIADLCAAHGRSTTAHIVVQFSGPLSTDEHAILRAGGLKLLNYVGNNAYFAAVDGARLDIGKLSGVSALEVALPIDPAWKLAPELVRHEVVPWMIVDKLDAEFDGQILIHGDPLVGVYVVFHPDVPMTTARTLVTSYGASIRSAIHSINALVVDLPYSAIALLADEGIAQYIEPPLPQFSEQNNSNRALVGADTAQAPPYGLDGTGVKVLVYDGGGVLATHADLAGRVRNGDGAGLSDHATHVAGTIGGTGAASSGLYTGMAPGVTIESYEFSTGGPLEEGFLYSDPGDLEADYNESINTYGADISNNSIGSNVAPNGFDCALEGNYGVTGALIDAIVGGSLGDPFRIVWAGGNERSSGRCGTTYYTTAPPAGAKNHLCVGAVNSNNDSITTFTSWGPTDDGRMKPDIVAPGCQSNDDFDVTSCSSSGGYTGKCGTSMASPTACGAAALLLQDYRVQYPDAPDFRNSTLKAIFAHTAVDIENPGPDFKSGYGSIRIVPAIDQMRSGNFFEQKISQGELVQVLVIVSPTDTELKVTLAWDDVPGTPAVSTPALVNDLDLRVFSPTLVQYYPWTLDPNNPANPAVQTQADHTNNIEQVYINAPAPGAYLVEIYGYNIPSGPQSFSLVASPLLVQCSTRGLIDLDRGKYPCQGIAALTVNDCDLNTDDLTVQTVDVTIDSNSEPAGEIVTLTETGPETALFVGTIPIDTVDSAGVLLVTEDDTITGTYIDADDGFGGTNVVVTDVATVDCTPPAISNVQIVDIEPRSARVTFDTNELANVTVRYGTDCATLTDDAITAGFDTTHSVMLNNLQDNVTYFLEIEAVDQAGNVSVDDNAGVCYSFTTPEIPDYFTEEFSPFDLQNTGLLFAPNGSVDYYGVCSFETLVLPTDPAGGNLLSLNDTGTATIQLSGGNSVLLYGTSYNTLYVNANGNITFDGPDSDSSETYDDHFDNPRVSGLFDDLDPSEGGQVSYKELSDRITVTWLEVPEDGAANDNTFQIELYYDGRIQLVWTAVAANDGLAGLSQGGGTPIDFLPSDLSTFDSCGPRPPSAASRTVVMGQDRSETFMLLASDDGLPDPPATLMYVVTSLPTYKLRDAGNDYLIQPGDLPYTLVGGGNALTYTPTGGFIGMDAFDFIANDGGTPPDGGDSNVATVTLQVDPVLDLPFYDEFPATDFDPNRWSQFDNVDIDDVGIDEPSLPYSARLNGSPSGRDELVSHFIDLTPYPAVELRYAWQRTGGGESPDGGDNLWVEYQDQNGVWQILTQYAGDGNDLTNYVSASINLPAAALHDSFRLRFRTKGSAGSLPLDDWFVDDVFIAEFGTPFAFSGVFTLPQDTQANATLLAEDPNSLPLTYTVLSLPTDGTLSDPNGGLIGAGDLPYAIIGSGNVVTYTPDLGFFGSDSFDFSATNGTLTSNVATMIAFVEPVLGLPFFEPFSTLELDPLRWSIVDGVTSEGLGLNKPSEPYCARFNAEPDGGDVLESYPVDLSTFANIHVRFYWERTGNGESPDAGEDLWVEYLNNSEAWVELVRYDGDGPDMTDFALEDIALPADAHHENFRLRFSNSSTGSSAIDDWFVDDIELYSADAPMAFDQTVGLGKFAWGDVTLGASDPNDDPLVYTLLTLPDHGLLIDRGDGTAVTSGDLPYDFFGGGNIVRFIPDIAYTGTDAFDFRVDDGVFQSNTATVSIQMGGVLPMLSFPLDTDPNWATEGLWEFGVSQGVGFDPPFAHTGDFIYGYNLAGNYEDNIDPPNYLTTNALDLTLAINTELRFQRWLGVEQSLFDHATIEISRNGTDWSTVWENDVININDLEWSLQTYDISTVADDQPTVYLRWGMGPTDSSATFSGWHLDDVAIYGEILGGPGDLDGDGDMDGDDIAVFRTHYPSCEGDAAYDAGADFDGDGYVTLADYLFWVLMYRDFAGDPNAPLPAGALGDYDGDGYVDVPDFVGLTECLQGPENVTTQGCIDALDINADGDVDTEDARLLALIYPY